MTLWSNHTVHGWTMIYVNTFYINYIIQLFLKTFIPVKSCKQYLLCVWYIHALWLCIVAVAKWLLINCECAWFFFILYEITSQRVSVFLLRDPHTFTNTPGFLWERKKEIKTNVNKTYFFNTTHCLHIKKKKEEKTFNKNSHEMGREHLHTRVRRAVWNKELC